MRACRAAPSPRRPRPAPRCRGRRPPCPARSDAGPMAFADLREFVAHLEKRGQLRRIAAPVSCDLEITEIADRVSRGPAEGNVALLFENVAGSGMPVLINAFGSRERMAAALGVEHLDDLSARVARLVDLRMPGGIVDKLRKLGDLFDLAKAG